MKFRQMYSRYAALIAIVTTAFMQPKLTAGPDVIVGDLPTPTRGGDLITATGRLGTKNGFGIGTTSCNRGTNAATDLLKWEPFTTGTNAGSTNHPVIAQNMYRLRNDRFEQIGESWVKHGFCALQNSVCGTCTAYCGGCCDRLGIGCSDPYSSSLNWTQSDSSSGGLGSRAWINPFTGVFTYGAANHSGHTHDATSHRCIVDDTDISSTVNPANVGARFFIEGQYVARDDSSSGNNFNNASYREFTIVGPTGTKNTYAFTMLDSAPADATAVTARMQAAVEAWPGASQSVIYPDSRPFTDDANDTNDGDGKAFLYYKVTGPVSGLYHYEYALYNMNLDRSIREFIVPIGACGVTITNIDFHAPPQHPGFANDNIPGGVGYSSTPWTQNKTATTMGWSTQTLTQNPAANAVRWGTLYNFRFDSNRPPRSVNATIGFFKTGGSMQVATQGPSPAAVPGDANLDSSVSTSDISSFVTALLNPSGLSAAQMCADDINGDLAVDGGDIQGFVQLLIH